ncbi:GspMb/PilO family protein [Roseateles sp.]|uniref:GspMb/PilO family protein n=1 Tax=Roseateles sp. TaxID=1971397 RepID=UPI003BAC6426
MQSAAVTVRAPAAVWATLKLQWQGNLRLQIGTAAIAWLVWLWACLVVLDQAKLLSAQAAADVEAAAQLRPALSQTEWPARADEMQRLLESARALQWTATSTGAAEAKLQDDLRAWATKAGLNVIELSVLPGAAVDAARGAAGASVRARLVTDLNRNALMAFLAQLQGAQPVVIVDTLKLRPAQTPARAELELRVQVRVRPSEEAGA